MHEHASGQSAICIFNGSSGLKGARNWRDAAVDGQDFSFEITARKGCGIGQNFLPWRDAAKQTLGQKELNFYDRQIIQHRDCVTGFNLRTQLNI